MRTRHLLLLTFIVLTALFASAQKTKADSANVTSHPIKVSLITFYPGDEIFEVFGHSEILLSDSTGYYYINYGVFDFNSPGFIMRYIMGETDYLCAIMPPNHDSGIKNGRKRVQQELNLTPEQAQKVWDALAWNVRLENREYRYRHFSDNCATRPRDVIENALGQPIDFDKCHYLVGKTLRQVMTHYTRNYPWEQFGIDLVLGAACDTVIDSRTHTFVPLFLMHALDSTVVMRDGQPVPLVSKRTILQPGSDNGIVAPPTPWYLTPMTMALIVLALSIAITVRDMRKGKNSRWYYSIFFLIASLAGCIVFFIEFISTHEAVMPNYNILWLHPLLLLLSLLPWFKKSARLLWWGHCLNIILILTTAVIWLSRLQVPNMAFLPLIAASLLCSISCLKTSSRT